jgi:hypothetical protein
MRPFVIGICLFAAACSGQAVTSPTPTSASLATAGAEASAQTPAGPAQIQSTGGSVLPFAGSFDIQTTGTFNCPPTCPPTTLVITGTFSGTATHLGRFTGTTDEIVDVATATGTGTFNLTAANGDQLFTTTVGQADQSTPPTISHVTETATIVGGTGRFAGATGTLNIEHTMTIDFSTGIAKGSGTIHGHLTLAR